MNLCTMIQNYFPYIEESCNKELLDRFCACKYSELHNYHWTLGLWLRNTLLNEPTLIQAFMAHEITEKDDMSALIIRLFYIYEKRKCMEQ